VLFFNKKYKKSYQPEQICVDERGEFQAGNFATFVGFYSFASVGVFCVFEYFRAY